MKLDIGGQWSEDTLTCINDALGVTLGVKLSVPDGIEGDWFVTDGHIWLVRMTSDTIVCPSIGYPPDSRLLFASMVLQNAGGSLASADTAPADASSATTDGDDEPVAT